VQMRVLFYFILFLFLFLFFPHPRRRNFYIFFRIRTDAITGLCGRSDLPLR
jgi:hypothetical protein